MDMDGEPMIDIVLRSLTGSSHIGNVIISIDNPDALKDAPGVQAAMAEGRVIIAESGDNPYISVLDALDDPSLFPVIVSTGDNALHVPEMVDFYCEAFTKSDADVSVAFCNEATISKAYLRGKNAHHQAETVFKAFGRTLRMAVEPDPRMDGVTPSTKGTLTENP